MERVGRRVRAETNRATPSSDPQTDASRVVDVRPDRRVVGDV